MALEQRNLADQFNVLCLQHLTINERNFVNTICGLNGRQAQSIAEIASKAQRSGDVVRHALNSALLKLPRAELTLLRDRLDDDTTADDSGLTAEQRRRLLKLIEYALIIQETYASRSRSQAAPRPVMPPPPSAVTERQRHAERPHRVERPRSRPQTLVVVLDQLGRPAHYGRIAEIAERYHSLHLKANLVYQTLVQHPDFISLGEGMFALARWQNRTADPQSGRLRYCPPLPLVDHQRSEQFFEQTMLVRDWVDEAITYGALLERMRNSGLTFMHQDLLDLWYAVGLLPSVMWTTARQDRVVITLDPSLPVDRARVTCLHRVVQRIDRMPETLSILAAHHHSTAAQIAEALHGDARDSAEIVYRLRLLESLSAVRSMHKKTWTLTALGHEVAQAHPPERDFEPLPLPAVTHDLSSDDEFWMLDP